MPALELVVLGGDRVLRYGLQHDQDNTFRVVNGCKNETVSSSRYFYYMVHLISAKCENNDLQLRKTATQWVIIDTMSHNRSLNGIVRVVSWI